LIALAVIHRRGAIQEGDHDRDDGESERGHYQRCQLF
jgi:hypothetical protein